MVYRKKLSPLSKEIYRQFILIVTRKGDENVKLLNFDPDRDLSFNVDRELDFDPMRNLSFDPNSWDCFQRQQGSRLQQKR